MRLILAVYDALRSYDRPATLKEIQAEAGLTREAAKLGLRGLKRRSGLMVAGGGRQRATYQLRSGTARPVDLRGLGEKSESTRAAMSAAHLARSEHRALGGRHWASRPPSHAAAPGAARRAPGVAPLPDLSFRSMMRWLAKG